MAEALLALIAIPVAYFLTLALAGAVIANADAWKICTAVVITLLIFAAITAH